MKTELQITATYMLGNEVRVASMEWTEASTKELAAVDELRSGIFESDSRSMVLVQPCGEGESRTLTIRATSIVDLTIHTRTVDEAP